ncbi:hypothetical protein ACWEQ1_30205 [Streptomyces nodosus]
MPRRQDLPDGIDQQRLVPVDREPLPRRHGHHRVQQRLVEERIGRPHPEHVRELRIRVRSPRGIPHIGKQ